jgi:hypothetical protein
MAKGINKDQKKENGGEIKAPLSHTDLIQFHNQVASKFTQIWKSGRKNEKRWLGDNWDESQKSKIRRQNRQAYSLPLLSAKLHFISATQKQLRTSYRLEPTSDPSAEIPAELATIQMRQVEARSNTKYIDSDTFDSGLAIKYGVRKVGLDPKSVIPRVVSTAVPWDNFVWDLNSREYDIKEDALFCAEVEKSPRVFLEQIYGKEAITGTAGQTQNSAFAGRHKMSYYVTFSKDINNPKPYDMISLFKHCQKVTRTFYYVLFADKANLHKLKSPLVGKYRTRSEAEDVLREMRIPLALNGLSKEGEIIEREEQRIDYYEFTYNKILYYEQTDWEMFPYDVFFSLRFEDKFVSYQDFLQDPQLIIDRMWAQIDYSLGKDIKNVYEGNRGALDHIETPESAELKASKTGGIIWTKGKEQVFRAIQSQGANPQWVNAIGLMVQYLEDMSGGRTFQGQAEGKSQSGKAISNLQKAGSVLASSFLDAFNRFKKNHGENVLWWIREFESEEDSVRVLGGALSPEMIELLKQENLYEPSKADDGAGYVKLNKGGMTYLKDADITLTVTEEGLTDSAREKRYSQLTEVGKDDPLLAQSPTFRNLRLEAMNLNHSDRQKIVKEAEEMQKRLEEQRQQELQLEQQKNQMQYGKDPLDQEKVKAETGKLKSETLDKVNNLLGTGA